MPAEPGRFSRSVEDYLKAIYSLTEGGTAASTKAISEALDLQPGSVTGMVKRLAETRLVEHSPYYGVVLTESGHREALRVVRRHRILETYLNRRLGFSWEEVHREAERLEHAASDALIEAMAKALEHPSHDPHGAPIPSPTGEIEATDDRTLVDASEGTEVTVRAVRDDDGERLRYMAELGLVPGARLTVDGREPFRGPLRIRVEGQDEVRVVGDELARSIFIADE